MAAETTTGPPSRISPSIIVISLITLVVACVLSAVILSSVRVATGANRILPVTESWFLKGWASNLVVHPGEPVTFVVRSNVARQVAWRASDATSSTAPLHAAASGVFALRADYSQPVIITAAQTRGLPPGSWLFVDVSGTARPLVIRVT